MSEKKLSRRDAIKLLGAVTGATVLANLPSKWSTPEIARGVLPAHAQTSCTPVSGSQTFSTPGILDFTVPACVTSLSVDAYGAQGGSSYGSGGLGGRAQFIIAVTPSETLAIAVGGQGADRSYGVGGGTNGGGVSAGDGGGGGWSGVMRGSTMLVVAGGGGVLTSGLISGGAGGNTTGGIGGSSVVGANAGLGGTQIDGGTGGTTVAGAKGGADGSAGTGGDGGDDSQGSHGGGYFGGGGGGGDGGVVNPGGGGGGSSYPPSATSTRRPQWGWTGYFELVVFCELKITGRRSMTFDLFVLWWTLLLALDILSKLLSKWSMSHDK